MFEPKFDCDDFNSFRGTACEGDTHTHACTNTPTHTGRQTDTVSVLP